MTSYDNDGDVDVDVVILNSRREPTILRNDSPGKNHWLQVQLHGTRGNRDGVGAQVRLHAGTMVLVDEVHSGRSYQSHYGTRLPFGLGRAERVDRIEVNWIGGGNDVLEDIPVAQCLIVEQGNTISTTSNPAPQ